MDDDTNALFAEVDLGLKAEAFFNSDVGRYLSGRALQAWNEARDALVDVDPNETKQVYALQEKAKIAQNFIQWISEAIQNGKSAEEILINQDNVGE